MNGKEDSKTKIIGTALKEWIEKSPYSKADVARMLGVSPQYINGLCQGKPIGKVMANKIANLFGLSEYFLLTGEGSLLVEQKDDPAIPSKMQDMIDQYKQEIKRLTDSIEPYKQEIQRLNNTVDNQREIIEDLKMLVNNFKNQYRYIQPDDDNPFVSDNTPVNVFDKKNSIK